MRRTVFNEDHEAFRETLRAFIEAEVVPVYDEWLAAGQAPRDFYYKLAELGVFGIEVPEEYGGAGESSSTSSRPSSTRRPPARASASAAPACTSLLVPAVHQAYATDEQKKRWLPDVRLRRDDVRHRHDRAGHRLRPRGHEDHRQALRGRHALRPQRRQDLHHRRRPRRPRHRLRPHRTRPPPRTAAHGISLFVVDTKSEGYSVGRKLDKLGLKTSDTAELSFADVKVPVEDLLGEESKGFSYLGHNLAAGAPGHRRRRLRAGRGRRPVRPGVRAGPHRLRQDRRVLPEHQVRAGRLQGRGGRRRGRRRPRPGGARRRRADRRRGRRPPSCSAPRSRTA